MQNTACPPHQKLREQENKTQRPHPEQMHKCRSHEKPSCAAKTSKYNEWEQPHFHRDKKALKELLMFQTQD